MNNKVMLATGNYINLYTNDGTYDVFIILNEANDNPTIDEIDKIESVVSPIIKDVNIKNIPEIEMQLEDIGLNCFKYGCQIIINNSQT